MIIENKVKYCLIPIYKLTKEGYNLIGYKLIPKKIIL